MTDLEKLKSLTAEIESMLSKRINPLSEEFVSWRTKTGRVLGRLYGEESNESKGFENMRFSSMVHIGGRDVGEENRAACQRALQTTRGKLTVYIEELEEEIEEEIEEQKSSNLIDCNDMSIMKKNDEKNYVTEELLYCELP